MQKDTELILNIIHKEGTNSRGNHVMDFSKEEHQIWLYEMFGGREHLEKEYPELYKLTEKTIYTAAIKSAENAEDTEDDPLMNLVFLMDTESNKKITGASGRAALKQPTRRLFASITLIQNGKELARDRDFFYDVEDTELKVTVESSDLASKTDLITCIFNAIWEDTADGVLHAESSIREDMEPFESDVVQDIFVMHPGYYENQGKLDRVDENASEPQPIAEYENPDTGRTGTINVSYARGPLEGEILDYNYDEERVGGLQKLLLDIRGQVILSAGYKYDKLVRVDCVLDILGDGSPGDGCIEAEMHPKDDVHVYAIVDEKKQDGFNFALPTYWNVQIPDSSFGGNKTYYLYAKIIFNLVGMGDKEYSISISSSETLGEESHLAEIPRLNLRWGCLQKDTMIRMADGTKKKVQDILKGEKIAGAGGVICNVINRTYGTEEELCFLKVEGYPERIGASRTHPFMTEDGIVAAGEIRPYTLLKMEDGEFHKVVECYRAEYGGEVYNLVLEPSHWFYADGFCTGDNVAQGESLHQSRNTVSLNIGPELIEEIKKLKREFKR